MKLLRELSWFFKSEWKRYSVAMVLLTGVALLNLFPPWITGRLVDQAIEGTLSASRLQNDVGLIVILGVAIYILRYLWRLSLYSASYKLGALLRQQVFTHLLKQSETFYNEHQTGDLLARSTNDITAIEMSAGEAILALFDGILTGVVVLTLLFTLIDWRLTLIALLPWPAMAFFFWRINREMHSAFHLAQKSFSDMNDSVQENISGIRLLRAYGLEQHATDQFNEKVASARDANLAVIAAEAKYGPVIFIVVGISFLFAVSGGAWFITQGSMTIGALTSFTLYLGYLIWPMFAYGWLLNLLERGTVAYKRIQELLKSTHQILPEGTETAPREAKLTWDINTFQFAGNKESALQSIKGSLLPGNTLGIVGPTGAGKSTLVKLLTYQLPATDRCNIHYGNNRFNHYTTDSLRQQMAIVSQEPFLFSASIAENISLGKPDASIDEIQRAASLACIDTDIQAFPERYQTLVGERGVTLSGGQKQRIAIARALLMDASLLVLDDALSAVDVETERTILQHLRKNRRGRTTIIVCHRLSALQHAEEILVLKHGQICERGNHQELLKLEGWYHQMHAYQQLEQAVIEGH